MVSRCLAKREELRMSDWDDLTAAAIAGKLNRRDFLLRASALGVTATMASSLLSRTALADTPKKGGTLKLGLAGGSTTDSLDPRTYTDTVAFNVGYQIMNGLLEVDPKKQIQPELLESWTIEPGAKKWVFKVRQGVTFHNGKTLDAEDILYSLNLHRGDSKSPMVGPLKNVTDAKVTDKNEITITLAEGDVDLLYVLADYHLLVVPKDFTDWSKPIGTGAYELDAWEPGVRAATKRAKGDYWKAGRGNVDGIEITVINDAAQRMNALITGQVDMIHRVDPKAVDLLKSAPGIELIQASGGYHYIMAMFTDTAPYNNKDLRLALKFGLDREQVLKTLLNGYGSIGNDHPIPKGDPFFNTQLEQRPYDPDKAKFHFSKADLGGGKVALSASDAAFAGAVDMAVLFQATAAKAGVPLTIKKEPADGFWDNVWLKAPFVTSYWGGRPAATQMLTIAYKSDAAWNDTHWKNQHFDELLASAKAETDEGKRKQSIWEMQAMLHEDGGGLIPVFQDWLEAHSSKVKGHVPSNYFDNNGGRLGEMAWIEG